MAGQTLLIWPSTTGCILLTTSFLAQAVSAVHTGAVHPTIGLQIWEGFNEGAHIQMNGSRWL